MATKPIIFNSEMVRAILDGRKTMTRRVIKLRPGEDALKAENARLRAELEAAKRDLAIVPTICFGGCSGDPSVGVPDCPFFDWVEGDKVGYREAARRCRYAENGGANNDEV